MLHASLVLDTDVWTTLYGMHVLYAVKMLKVDKIPKCYLFHILFPFEVELWRCVMELTLWLTPLV